MISTVVAATLLALPTLSSAYKPALTRKSDVPGTVELPLTLIESGASEGPQYLVNISIGTPPQEVTVQIDTGSADLWVFASDNVCDNTYGCLGSSFSENGSTTLNNDMPNQFAYSYGSGANGTGDYVTDTIYIGDKMITNARFGVAHQSSGISPLYGIMGLGFPSGEFASNQNLFEYNTTVMTMANQGVINSAAFSLYLNDVASQGSILFGGYDTAKYTGDLKTLDLIDLGDYDQYYVNLTALGTTSLASNGSSTTSWYGNSSVAGAAFIDCGSPKMFLPSAGSIDVILNSGGEWDGDLTFSLIPCSARNDNTTFVDVQLGGSDPNGPLIQIPVSELVEPYPTNPNLTINGEPACSFGVSPGPDGFQILGDAFIRNTYIVFNMDNHTVSLGNVILNATDSNIFAI